MYSITHSSKIHSIFKKLAKKNPNLFETITKKLEEITEDPHRFKPLSNIMKGLRRVRFVLIYSILEDVLHNLHKDQLLLKFVEKLHLPFSLLQKMELYLKDLI